MKRITSQNFENEEVEFDGRHFISCSFTNCSIIISSLNFDFDRCSFIGTVVHVNPELSIFKNLLPIAQSSYHDIACRCRSTDPVTDPSSCFHITVERYGPKPQLIVLQAAPCHQHTHSHQCEKDISSFFTSTNTMLFGWPFFYADPAAVAWLSSALCNSQRRVLRSL
jgi:hypothetical protein